MLVIFVQASTGAATKNDIVPVKWFGNRGYTSLDEVDDDMNQLRRKMIRKLVGEFELEDMDFTDLMYKLTPLGEAKLAQINSNPREVAAMIVEGFQKVQHSH